MLLVLLLVLLVFRQLLNYYERSCIELQRLDSVSRSPIQSHFNECLQGTSTIRAFRAEHRFTVENDDRVDVNSSAVM